MLKVTNLLISTQKLMKKYMLIWLVMLFFLKVKLKKIGVENIKNKILGKIVII
jgi:hypothetical protein